MGLATSAYRRVEPARLEQRSAARFPVTVKRASVRRHGRKAIDAQLDDLSIYGCRLIAEGDFAEGDRLVLHFADGDAVTASAIWHQNGKLGCRFDSPLDRSLFRALTLGLT